MAEGESIRASNVVKLRAETYERVKQMAHQENTTLQDVIVRGLEALEGQEFARAFQEDYAALRADEAAWAKEQAERGLWESTLTDGLDE